jgi:hypothetical protein
MRTGSSPHSHPPIFLYGIFKPTFKIIDQDDPNLGKYTWEIPFVLAPKKMPNSIFREI